MKRLLYAAMALCIVLCLYNCNVTYDFRPEWQTARFKANEDTQIDMFLDTDGYYTAANYSDSVRTLPFILYNDGSFGPFQFLWSANYAAKPRDIDMCNDSLIDMNKSAAYYYCQGGHYVIREDTIIADLYYYTTSAMYGLFKLKFTIVDRQHLRLVQRQYFSLKHDGIITENADELYEYIPVKRKLPSTGVHSRWSHKALWDNETERKAWKRYCSKIEKAYIDSVRKEKLLRDTVKVHSASLSEDFDIFIKLWKSLFSKKHRQKEQKVEEENK